MSALAARVQVRGVRVGPTKGVATAVALAAVAVAYILFRNGGWVYDDNFILLLAKRAGFTWSWLDTPIFQHWDIGMNAAYSALLGLFPLDFRWGLLAMLLVLGGSIVLFERVLALLIGRGWTTIVAAAWFGISILWTRQLQWWAAGVQELPTVLCDLICVYGFLRFTIDQRNRWAVCSAAGLAIGLLFYEKPALMIFYLALARILLMSERLSPRPLLLTFWRERTLWLAYLVVVGVWGFGYLSSGALDGANFGHIGLSQYLSFFRIMWVNTLAPALAGLTLPATNLSGGQIVAAVVVQLAFVALLVVSVRRKRSAWRGWLFLVLTILIDGGIVAHARVGLFGPNTGNDLRYLLDFTWLVPIALCAAFSSERVLLPAVATAPRPPGRPRLRPAMITAAVLAAYVGVSLATAAHLQASWDPVAARQWEANVERGFDRLGSQSTVPVVLDQAVPFDIVSSAFEPLNRLSYVLPLYASGYRVDGPITGPLVTVGPSGDVVRATLVPLSGANLAAARIRSTGALLTRRAGSICVASGPGGARLVTPTSIRVAGAGPFYLDVTYSAPRPFEVVMLQDSGRGFASSTPTPLVLAPYARSSVAWLGTAVPRRIELELPPHASVCLRQLAVTTART